MAEPHLHRAPEPHTGCGEGSALAWHTWQPALPPPAFASAPLCPGRDAPAATSLAAQRRQALLMGALKSVSCGKRKRGEEGGEQSSTVECFSSQITWRCSQISAYIGFSLFLFLFPKQSPLLYDKKKKKYMNAFTC